MTGFSVVSLGQHSSPSNPNIRANLMDPDTLIVTVVAVTTVLVRADDTESSRRVLYLQGQSPAPDQCRRGSHHALTLERFSLVRGVEVMLTLE